MNVEMNCLSYWFPKIRDAGLPVPRTKIVMLPDELREPIFRPFDGKAMGAEVQPFFDELRAAAESIGLPCFPRTGQSSGKHNWKNTCCLTDPAALESHVLSLIEFSECAGMFGIPWNVWCVREFLPTTPLVVADLYGNMPVCREFRLFVKDGEVVCSHPYWTIGSLVDGMSRCPEDLRQRYRALCSTYATGADSFDDESDDLESLAERAGQAVGGSWSVDILHTQRGWFVTDMALAGNSFHWEGCEHAKDFNSPLEV